MGFAVGFVVALVDLRGMTGLRGKADFPGMSGFPVMTVDFAGKSGFPVMSYFAKKVARAEAVDQRYLSDSSRA